MLQGSPGYLGTEKVYIASLHLDNLDLNKPKWMVWSCAVVQCTSSDFLTTRNNDHTKTGFWKNYRLCDLLGTESPCIFKRKQRISLKLQNRKQMAHHICFVCLKVFAKNRTWSPSHPYKKHHLYFLGQLLRSQGTGIGLQKSLELAVYHQVFRFHEYLGYIWLIFMVYVVKIG